MCGQVVINIGGFRVTPCASAVSIFLGPLRGGLLSLGLALSGDSGAEHQLVRRDVRLGCVDDKPDALYADEYETKDSAARCCLSPHLA